METCKIKNLYNLEETIAKDLFEGAVYPWEVLPKISDFIKKLGATLSEEEYEKRGEDIWIAKSATVAPTAYIHGPAILGKEAEVRHCAFIRGKAIIGEGAVVGNSTELKNSVLFRKVFVGEGATVENSVIMKSSYIGKGCVIKNAIIDKEVVISDNKEVIGTEEEPIVIGKGQVI